MLYLKFLAGFAIVIWVMHDVFQSVVVPRWSSRSWRLAPNLTDWLWPVFKNIANYIQDGEKREDFLGNFAPISLVISMVAWLLLLILGFGLMILALHGETKPMINSLGGAMYFAGVTLLTIGYGDIVTTGGGARVVVLAAAASGLAVFALVVSLLFTLYGAFERREVMVLQLDARAGTPPSGVTLLETFALFDLLDTLPHFFGTWETWAAEVLQSHIAYPLLPFFRSGHDRESWVSSLGAVLDAATLLLTTVQTGGKCGSRPVGAAHMMYKLGCHTVIDLSHWFGYRFDEDPDQRPGVERTEWVLARKRLEKAGFLLQPEAESWILFQKKRAVYAASLNELAKHFATPPAQWIGDRSLIGIGHRSAEPRLPLARNRRETSAETK